MYTPEEILDFWFGAIDEEGRAAEGKAEIWFKKSDETDDLIRERFGSLVQEVGNGQHVEWAQTARGRLALIITQDQFTRNIYRNQPQTFAHDTLARWLAQEGIALGQDKELAFIERVFFYIPFEHAEDREMQIESVRLYQQLLDEVPEHLTEQYANFLDYAHRHKVIVDRFGRYPHRNTIMQRPSTLEEQAFLEEPGSSF